MNIIVDAIDLLEKGHVEQADLELLRWLGHQQVSVDDPTWCAASDAAQLIHPLGKPKQALTVLRKELERQKQGESENES
ncbi:MAG: hypothetical protein KGL39_10235 [Patescibacteria group bacterium]|nr:hypothetical protein [Patescibacteria group bacterium]